jgi:hypothetical protein
MAYFALSFDHRIIDGSDAERFLAYLKELLEKVNSHCRTVPATTPARVAMLVGAQVKLKEASCGVWSIPPGVAPGLAIKVKL